MPDLIDRHFFEMDLDLRRQYPGHSRYMDQKVTPDVLSFIADCILNLPDREIFSIRDVWGLQYFEKNVVTVFGKPPPWDPTASAEYNKFIGQPIKALAYAGVLAEIKLSGTRYRYSITNQKLLDHISWNERSALEFLQKYIAKVLTDSGFIRRYNRYRKQMERRYDRKYFSALRSEFDQFMLGNTKINQVVEVRRIFPKVINPLAVRDGLPGAEKGRVTRYPFMYRDLMYNRLNLRDIAIGKPKGVTRREYATQTLLDAMREVESLVHYREYNARKAIRKIRSMYARSEVRGQGEAGQSKHVHHIFPKSQYPELAAYPENLIVLTPEQHLEFAHPKSQTSEADPDYQLQCLLAKCDNIEKSLRKGENIYSKKRLVEMLNFCLELEVTRRDSFAKIKEKLRARQVQL